MADRLIILILTLFSFSCFALKVGDTMPNYCWKDEVSDSNCVDTFRKNVVVLMFMAGWCNQCNAKIEEIIRRAHKFEDDPVVFMNILISGWRPGTKASPHFLNEWRNRLAIPPEILVLSSNPQQVEEIGGYHSIPLYIIVDSKGKVSYIEAGCNVSELFARIQYVLTLGFPS